MKDVQRKTKEALEGARNPALLASFGKDSLLLLFLAHRFKPDIPIVWFDHRASEAEKRFAKKIIRDWNLTVFTYSPMDTYFLPNNEGLTLVDEYSFSEARMPVLTDVSEGETCGLNVIGERTPFFGYPFDVTLVGWKSCDGHFTTGRNPFPVDGFQFGGTRMFAPLRDLTDAQVLDAIRELGIPYEEIDDSLSLCTRCLSGQGNVFCPEQQREIPSVVWDKELSLKSFRSRFTPVAG
jgi:3'-phosphoadenosine 5'-phosphosulfate sulfotransferase (PAPS reductase)/FAD synthetase